MKIKLCFLIWLLTHLHLVAAERANPGYVAHEWGTFTSVQGADGVQLAWNPLQTTDLPKFVYDLRRPGGTAQRQASLLFETKSALVARQRMETPVIYFYSDQERMVDVRVDFPQGRITEWYPQATEFGPFSTTNKHEQARARQSFLHWAQVQVLPQARNSAVAGLVPTETGGSHYYAAREADAAFVRVSTGVPLVPRSRFEHEKFLFYRGVGSFQAPLRVKMAGPEDELELTNAGTEELAHFVALRIHQGQGARLYVDRLAPGETKTLELKANPVPLSDLQKEVGARLAAALVAEGLYVREAEAMIATWRDSWFAEEGLRVLYVLPRAWTDRVLPLSLAPKPRELARVMLGRAEMITPTAEWEVLKQIVRFSDPEPQAQFQAVASLRQLDLGRFTEVTVRRVLGGSPCPLFSQSAQNLLEAAYGPEKDRLGLARK